jgi:hypothetical protein
MPQCSACASPASQAIDFAALPCGWMPLDMDTFAMDQPEGRRTPRGGGTERSEGFGAAEHNSGTAKEHVGRTYAGVDGYCPLVSYLDTQGFCLESMDGCSPALVDATALSSMGTKAGV